MSIKINEIIKGRRKAKKWSQEKFAEKIGASPAAVKSWERENDPVLPDTKFLISMCREFDCDLDYLIGRIPQQTHAIKTACEVTGLSEDAIKKLSGAKNSGYADVISHLIECEGITKLILSYRAFYELLDKLAFIDTDYKTAGVSVPDLRMRKNGQIVMSTDEAIHHYITRTSMILTEICEDDYNRKVKEDGIRRRSLDDYKYLLEEIDAVKEEYESLNRLKNEIEGEADK